MKNKRSSIIADVLYSLQWFFVVFALSVAITYSTHDEPFSFCLRMLPCAAAFVIVALAVRLTESPLLRILALIAAVVGCVLMGKNIIEWILLSMIGLTAVGSGFLIHSRIRRNTSPYKLMFLFVFFFALLNVAADGYGWGGAQPWLSVISAVYLPLCVVVWYVDRLAEATIIFDQRADQPTVLVNKRMGKIIAAAALLVLVAALMIPQANGVSMLAAACRFGLKALLVVVVFIAKLFPVFRIYEEDIAAEEEEEINHLIESSSGSGYGVYLVYFIAASLFLVVLIMLCISVIRLIKRIIEDFMRYGEAKTVVEEYGSDTIEKLGYRRKKESERQSGRSNAGKIRRIYRRRVAEIIGSSVDQIGSLAPDEIAALCEEKGENITELTALYKKARYTRSCTADDVKNARRL